jgi:8-oxo-dGTP diphosphatase
VKVNFYDAGAKVDEEIIYVVIVSRYKRDWILVRHRDRITWEVPGGHRELDEDPDQAARRELFEETGADEFELFPVCIYSVSSEEKTSYGKLYFAEVKTIRQLPESEIKEICLKKDFPKDNLTYPMIQPHLFKRVTEYLQSI